MRVPTIIIAAVAALAVPLLLQENAAAQPPLYNLPSTDFRWNWGRAANAEDRAGRADIEASGSEAGFRCELLASISPASTMSTTEYRTLENQLSTRLDFIYAVSEAMNYLDSVNDLDWATLDCKKFKAAPVSAEESAQREAEARDKMLRELEKRRERAQRNAE
jgi:hypothetical protein